MKRILFIGPKPFKDAASAAIGFARFELEWQTSGENAIPSCLGDMPDGILLDDAEDFANMRSFCQRLRTLPQGETAKIILCVERPPAADFLAILEADAFVRKPLESGALQRKFRELALVK